MYAKITNNQVEKYPYSSSELRKDNPETSFPKDPLSDDVLANYGVFRVLSAGSSQYNAMTERVSQGTPIKNQNGEWVQNWVVTSLSDEEKAEKIAQVQNQIVEMTQYRLDEFARERGYDDIKSASDYAGCSVPKFSQEGTYCRDARAETWQKLYEILDEVNSGTRPQPASFVEIEPELPQLVWPN